MAICKRDGCDNDAVGVQLVRADPPAKLADWCRPHHVEERRAAGVLDTVEVATNRALIMGVDGSENKRGARIELDREEIDIDMLVDLGYVRRIVVNPEERLAQIRAESASLEAKLADLRKMETETAAATEDAAAPSPAPAADAKAPKTAAPKA